MKKLTVHLENCYGIKSLDAAFDFTGKRVYAIYAPNGAMKSSFAKTFKDYSMGAESGDRIFPDRACVRSIVDESGSPIADSSVFVVSPYDEDLAHTEKTSTLLVDNKLRKEYEKLHIKVDEAEKLFLDAMKEESGSKKDIRSEISSAFTKSDDFYRALTRVQQEVADQKTSPWVGVDYDTIFDPKVIQALGTKDAAAVIADYVTKYNELLEASTYFKRGIFNYYNASSIAKSLADHGFFSAKHTVRLNAKESMEITSQKELEQVIQKEKDGITNDKALKAKFAALEKLLEKNQQCRDFQGYLDKRPELIPRLANIEDLKEDIWKSYFKNRQDLYDKLLSEYQAAQKRKKEIQEAAAKQRTQWEDVIAIFNDRFFVPFKLEAKNRIQVILGNEPVLSLGFTFDDGDGPAPVARDTLLQVLSQGEKKALYVLNIIFEVEVRRKASTETLFVFDDIADSFDYRNKYAIIQYMDEISQEPIFRQIILTHNFDFYRTLESRFVPYKHCLMAIKTDGSLALEKATGIKNVFVKDWKNEFFKDAKKRIASIPFMRNLIEYTRGESDADYLVLTSLLHWKADSAAITQSQLDDIYKSLFGQSGDAWANPAHAVIDDVAEEAEKCLSAPVGFNFENKIVLAIATRLCAEKFMVARINDPAFVSGIQSNQTQSLLKEFRKRFPNDSASTQAVQRVILMTPENIHLNSFMYEPIVDMSDEHLRKLYKDVRELK